MSDYREAREALERLALWPTRKLRDVGFTQEEVGEMVGVTQQRVGQIENAMDTREASSLVSIPDIVRINFCPDISCLACIDGNTHTMHAKQLEGKLGGKGEAVMREPAVAARARREFCEAVERLSGAELLAVLFLVRRLVSGRPGGARG